MGEALDDEREGSTETVLVAEDETAMRELIANAMRRAGYRVVQARNGIDLLAKVEEELGDCDCLRKGTVIVSDIRMRQLDGLRLLETLRSTGVIVPMILVTAFGDEETHARARTLGAEAVLDKPFEMEALLEAVREALHKQKAIVGEILSAPSSRR